MSSNAVPAQPATQSSDVVSGNDGGGLNSDTVGSGGIVEDGRASAPASTAGDGSAEHEHECWLIFEDIAAGKIDIPAGYIRMRGTGVSLDEANRLMGCVLEELDQRRGEEESNEDDLDVGQASAAQPPSGDQGHEQPQSNGGIQGPLLAAASIVLQSGIDVKVCHIPGKDNLRADLLSRALLSDYERLFPADKVHRFEPPRHLLPDCPWKGAF
jgi:hypothetical protein